MAEIERVQGHCTNVASLNVAIVARLRMWQVTNASYNV